jgi:hypothetical protein
MLDEYLLSAQKQTSPTIWPPTHRRKRPLVARIDTERVTVTGATATMTAAKRAAKTATKTATRGGHRAPHRRHCLRRDQELVGIGELRLPDPAAMVAANLPGPAFGRPQACHFDAIGCSAVWTDDQHWRIGKREKRTPGTLTAVC